MLLGRITSHGELKKGADLSRQSLKLAQVRLNFFMQVIGVGNFAPAQRSFDVAPNLFVRVDLGAVGRQKEQFKLSSKTLDASLDLFGLVHGMAVQDQKHRALGS